CAVADVDVLTVEPEARVEAAELLEHPAPEQEETAEQPVGAHRLGGILVEVVVRTLTLERRSQQAHRGSPNERAAHRREAARGGPEPPVLARHARSGNATPPIRRGERAR